MNEFLSLSVLWMGLSRIDYLDGPFLVCEYPLQAFDIVEEEGGPLVRGKTSGESNGERLWVEDLVCLLELVAGCALFLELFF